VQNTAEDFRILIAVSLVLHHTDVENGIQNGHIRVPRKQPFDIVLRLSVIPER
jgi:hypothetical protein